MKYTPNKRRGIDTPMEVSMGRIIMGFMVINFAVSCVGLTVLYGLGYLYKYGF